MFQATTAEPDRCGRCWKPAGTPSCCDPSSIHWEIQRDVTTCDQKVLPGVTCTEDPTDATRGRVSAIHTDNFGLLGALSSLITDASRLPALAYLTDLTIDNEPGVTGSLPPAPWTGGLANLKSLTVRHTKLNGGIVGQLNEWTVAKAAKLDTLDLSFNELTGSLGDANDGTWAMKTLKLRENQMSGHIGETLLKQGRDLVEVDIRANLFAWTLPREVQGVKWEIFLAGKNRIDGKLPEVWPQTLNRLDLSFNFVSGPVPASYKEMGLKTLLLGGNEITCGGEVPKYEDWAEETDKADFKCADGGDDNPATEEPGVGRGLMIVGISAAAVFAVSACLWVYCRNRKLRQTVSMDGDMYESLNA